MYLGVKFFPIFMVYIYLYHLKPLSCGIPERYYIPNMKMEAQILASGFKSGWNF